MCGICGEAIREFPRQKEPFFWGHPVGRTLIHCCLHGGPGSIETNKCRLRFSDGDAGLRVSWDSSPWHSTNSGIDILASIGSAKCFAKVS